MEIAVARYFVIHNPISGQGRSESITDDICRVLNARGHETVDCRPTSADEAVSQVQKIATDTTGVISVGGDGTHNTIVNGMLGSDIPLLPVPAGTENILSFTLGIPGDAEKIADILEHGRVRQMDVGLANGRAFLIMSGVGFDARITQEVHRHRHGPIHRSNYYWPTFKELMTYDFPPLKVQLEGREVAVAAGFLVIGNLDIYADRLHLCDRALPDDGLLDMVIFTKPGRLRLIWSFLLTKLRQNRMMKDVIYLQGRKFSVTAEREGIPYQVDGDVMGTAPVTYDIRDKAIRVFTPPQH